MMTKLTSMMCYAQLIWRLWKILLRLCVVILMKEKILNLGWKKVTSAQFVEDKQIFMTYNKMKK